MHGISFYVSNCREMILVVLVARNTDAFIAPIKFNGTLHLLRRELFKVGGGGRGKVGVEKRVTIRFCKWRTKTACKWLSTSCRELMKRVASPTKW